MEASEIGEIWDDHLNRLQKITQEINNSTEEELLKVDEMDRQLSELVSDIRTEVMKKHSQNMRQIQQVTDRVTSYKAGFARLNDNIEKTCASSNETVKHEQAINKDFKDLVQKTLACNNIDAEYDAIKFEKPEFLKHLDNVGKERVRSSKVRVHLRIPNKFTKFCISSHGLVAMVGRIDDTYNIRCFGLDGKCIWQINLGKVGDPKSNVRSMSFISPPNQNEVLVISRNGKTEIRCIDNGRTIQVQDTQFNNLALLSKQQVVMFWS